MAPWQCAPLRVSLLPDGTLLAKISSAEHTVQLVMSQVFCRHLHGAYKGGTPPFECATLEVDLQANGTLVAKDFINELLVEGGAHNKAAREVFAGSDIVMTSSWNATVELFEYHRELADGRGHECGESSLHVRNSNTALRRSVQEFLRL